MHVFAFQTEVDTLYRMSTPYRPTAAWDPNEEKKPDLPALRRDLIVDTAMVLADQGGIDEASIRKVAGELGVGPMRLYKHVPTKADLLALMVEAVYREIAAELTSPALACMEWQERVQRVGHSFRKAAFQHVWFVDLLTGRPNLGPSALAVLEVIAAAVEAIPTPHTAESTRLAIGAVNAYMIGATRTDVLERQLTGQDGSEEAAWQVSAQTHLREVFATGEFPTLEHLAFEAVMPDPDAEFTWGLSAVLRGIERKMHGRSRHDEES